MKKIFFFTPFFILLLSACSWTMNDPTTIDDTLPSTDTPVNLVGEWANGYTSFTQVVDAYNGRYLGSTWQSGKYFKFTASGKASEFYFMAKSQYATSSTKAMGTIRFDIGSTSESGSFTFLALKGHYKGKGSINVDRDATENELKNSLTQKYFYRMEGGWLRIEPGAEPSNYTSSFRKISEP
jgi:hypothetical protein